MAKRGSIWFRGGASAISEDWSSEFLTITSESRPLSSVKRRCSPIKLRALPAKSGEGVFVQKERFLREKARKIGEKSDEEAFWAAGAKARPPKPVLKKTSSIAKKRISSPVIPKTIPESETFGIGISSELNNPQIENHIEDVENSDDFCFAKRIEISPKINDA